MLTPLFDIEQTAEVIIVTIKAPLAKASSTEISVDGNELIFSAKPYFLRLYLPKNIVENGKETVEHNPQSGEFKIVVFKETYGEFFPGLDFITKLLTPNRKNDGKPLIEELNGNGEELAVDGTVYFEQKISTDPTNASCSNYGFANTRSGIFSKLGDEIGNLIDIPDPDNTENDRRKQLALQSEKDKFSDDHYLADLFAPENLEPSTSFKAWWDETTSNNHVGGVFCAKFTLEEKDRLKDLPKKDFRNLTDSDLETVYYSLVDILYAYAYDHRVTCGENNSESGWLIAKLSSTLSCLTSWDNIKDCMIACVRRSLCFPLYRNWRLALKVLEDVEKLCRLGRIAIIKSFLDIHKIFANSGEYRYILNDLYIADYCVWLQQAKETCFMQLAEDIRKMKICKSDIGLDLDELELAAKLAIEEDSEANFNQSDTLDIGERTLLEYVRGHAIADNEHERDSDDSDSVSGAESDPDMAKLRNKVSSLKFL